LIRSRVQVSNFYPQVINAQTARKVALEALAIALDLPKNQEITLTDELRQYPLESLEFDDPLGMALQNRSELKQLDFQQEMLQKLRKIERHGVWWPNIFLVGGYSLSAQEPDFNLDDYYWIESLYGGISISIPLFDGLRASHRAQQAEVDLKLLDLQKDQLIRGINLEIIQAQDKLDQALKNVKAQKEGRELAGKGLSIAEVRYQNGLATHLEVLDAQVALNQAETNELSAYYDAIVARAEFEKAIGNN
jgi:outer membrane protein TolC